MEHSDNDSSINDSSINDDSENNTISDILDNLMMLIINQSSPQLANDDIYINQTQEYVNSQVADANTGYANTGYANTGYANTGYANTGYANTGYANTGYANTGYANTGEDYMYNHVLNSSLNDKFTYKYILSEEGEAQLTPIKFTNELRAINHICPITSLEFEDNQTIISLPCSHYFDPDSINKWVREEKAECPVCRFKLHSKEVKIDEKNYTREDLNSLFNLYHSRINLINALSRISYTYNPFSNNYFNMLIRERDIYEENNNLIQNMTYTIFRQF